MPCRRSGQRLNPGFEVGIAHGRWASQVRELRLECGLDSVAAMRQEIDAGLAECGSIVTRRELVRILAEDSLFTGQEVGGGGLGRRVFDIGLC